MQQRDTISRHAERNRHPRVEGLGDLQLPQKLKRFLRRACEFTLLRLSHRSSRSQICPLPALQFS